MKKYNLIMVYNKEFTKILMCKREKDPYKGLYNLVGGKVEKGEKSVEAAYRELFEETGIYKENIELKYFMDFKYYIGECCLEVYVGKLNKNVKLIEEINKLFWVNLDNDFFDITKYAGTGNIGHMLEQVKINKDKIF